RFGSICVALSLFLFVFFFFQAEDGIRDFHVTGVQTCALPIYECLAAARRLLVGYSAGGKAAGMDGARASHRRCQALSTRLHGRRSEERRVGKECRARWERYREQKKQEVIRG